MTDPRADEIRAWTTAVQRASRADYDGIYPVERKPETVAKYARRAARQRAYRLRKREAGQ